MTVNVKEIANISDKDTLNVVRMCILCADILRDYNEIENLVEEKQAKHFKQTYKKDLIEFMKCVEEVSTPLLTNMVQHDDMLVVNLQKTFTDVSSKIFFVNKEITSMQLIAAKAVCLYNIIKRLDYNSPDFEKLSNLSHRLVVTYSKQHNKFYMLTDEYQHGLPSIALAMFNLSDKILFKPNTEEDASTII